MSARSSIRPETHKKIKKGEPTRIDDFKAEESDEKNEKRPVFYFSAGKKKPNGTRFV